MPPSLPVPSKAAVLTLRSLALGTAFGTSCATACALGVLLQERRRRIRVCERVHASMEKIRSSPRYVGRVDLETLYEERVRGESKKRRVPRAQIDSLEGDAEAQDRMHAKGHEEPTVPAEPEEPAKASSLPQQASDANALPFHPPNQGHTAPRWQSVSSSIASSRHTCAASRRFFASRASQEPSTSVPPVSRLPNAEHSDDWPTGPLSDPTLHTRTIEERVAEIYQILDSGDAERLSLAVSKFDSISKAVSELASQDQQMDSLLELSARISRECQAREMWDEATAVLTSVVGLGPLDESKFHAHRPFPVIDHHLRSRWRSHETFPERVALATKIFLARLKDKPKLHAAESERLARPLIALALQDNQHSLAEMIYWRALCQSQDPPNFAGWTIRQFCKSAWHKQVLRFFRLNYSRMRPSQACFQETMPCVAESAQAVGAPKANAVLEAFARMDCPGGVRLRATWLMQLLEAYWQWYKDLQKSVALFEEVVSLGLLEKITRPQGLYRQMVECAVRAGDDAVARSYREKLIALDPTQISDVRLNGQMALLKAQAGDWNGVLEDFAKIQPMGQGKEEYDQIFVMVSKIYAETHSASEIRDLVTKYTSDLGVRLHRYLVTLVAKEYSACHDMPGLLSWLQYCGDMGFARQPGALNSILVSGRTSWNLSYQELQLVRRTLLQLNPNAEDDVTRRILIQAAVHSRKSQSAAPEAAEGPRASAGLTIIPRSAHIRRSMDSRDVYEAMNRLLQCGKPRKVLNIYQHASELGIPFSSHCLRLAVLAALQSPNSTPAAAFALIRNAHRQGRDVAPAVSVYIKTQLHAYESRADNLLVYMQNLIRKFGEFNIPIDTSVLVRMAFVCMKIKEHQKAIDFCNLAKERSGATNLCFSKDSFMVLSLAYSRLLDLDGMRSVLVNLFGSPFADDKVIRAHLKGIRRSLRKLQQTWIVQELIYFIGRALDITRQLRSVKQTEGDLLKKTAFRIAMKAARKATGMDAGVDVDEKEPFLEPHTDDKGYRRIGGLRDATRIESGDASVEAAGKITAVETCINNEGSRRRVQVQLRNTTRTEGEDTGVEVDQKIPSLEPYTTDKGHRKMVRGQLRNSEAPLHIMMDAAEAPPAREDELSHRVSHYRSTDISTSSSDGARPAQAVG
ncbi:hypothetical protein GGR56DRAFT_621277 [Xylariaceae sp. FL0804]|nr:hypothetical protein GGR56DRAFT_621277 [Xylariaceae sp. FL0804]